MIAYRSVESETEQLWDSPGRLSKGEEAEEKENAGEGGCGEGYHLRPIIRPPFVLRWLQVGRASCREIV